MDPIEAINFKKDSTLAMMLEAQSRTHQIFYMTTNSLFIESGKAYASSSRITVRDDQFDWFSLEEEAIIALSDLDAILMRQDPPFNSEYLITTLILDGLKKVRVINNPTAIRNVSEKLYSKHFIKFMPNTLFSNNIEEIKKFYEQNKNMIMKPINGYGGNQIHLIKNKFNKKLITNFLNKNGHSMFQKFLKNISKGDKRVFIINGKVKGAIRRLPKKNSILSNISQGGTALKTKLNSRELKISKLVAGRLKKSKIFFAGIDLVGGYLIGDINVTSPTGLPQYKKLTGINLAKDFWNEIEKLK